MSSDDEATDDVPDDLIARLRKRCFAYGGGSAVPIDHVELESLLRTIEALRAQLPGRPTTPKPRARREDTRKTPAAVVEKIQAAARDGETYEIIAKRFGVSLYRVWKAVRKGK